MPALKSRKTEGPAGGAGLIRYFDVDEGGPKMNPRLIIGIVLGFIILELMFKLVLS